MSSYNLKSFSGSLLALATVFILTSCDFQVPNMKFDDFEIPNPYECDSCGGLFGIGYFGKIVNNETQEPISDAKIIWNDQLYKSNSVGYYEIINPSEYFEITIKVSKPGYEDNIQFLRITNEDAKELNIFMTPTVKSLK